MNYRIISADDHIDMQWLPRDLWQKRVPAAWRARAPRVVETDAGPYWVCGEERGDPWGGRKGVAGSMGGRRLALEKGGVLEPGVLRPTTTALRLADMDRDGVGEPSCRSGTRRGSPSGTPPRRPGCRSASIWAAGCAP